MVRIQVRVTGIVLIRFSVRIVFRVRLQPGVLVRLKFVFRFTFWFELGFGKG